MIFAHSVLSLFAPMFIVYVGFGFIFGNNSAVALRDAEDKSNASALMSFINMSSAVVVVMLLSAFPIHAAVMLPLLYFGYLSLGILWYCLL